MTLTIPTSVTSIQTRAFSGCSNLTSVVIPDNVTNLGGYAFENCTSLTSFTLPNNCTTIPQYLLAGCSNLTSFTIPSSVRAIENGAFKYCSSLQAITIPNGVTQIPDYAFHGCSSLTEVNIPNSVINIWGHNFEGCTSLTEIRLPNQLQNIGYYTFYNCSSLTSVDIPEGVTEIGPHAFSNCTALTKVTLPSTLTKITFSGYSTQETFANCTSLSQVVSAMESPMQITQAFKNISPGCVLTIPVGTKILYQKAGWTTDVFRGGVVEAGNAAPEPNMLEGVVAKGNPGRPVQLSIAMTNAEDIKGIQFDMILPEGVDVATDEYNNYAFSLTDRAHSSHDVSSNKLENNTYRVVVSSMLNGKFKGHEGVVVKATLNIPADMAIGEYPIVLKGIELTTTANEAIRPANRASYLRVAEMMMGDVNNDDVVSVTDVGMVVSHILEVTPEGFNEEAADMNGDGNITVTDASIIISIILNKTDSDAKAHEATPAEPTVDELMPQ